ncbi:queuosine precursor transporter [Phyllobacterium sp. 0TCS1.6C]|uniref:queuosine precursor transporter n=1 Tax=unclassified Phyllobacterium TaxID=2638441 RepID=UPI0022651412|nr:MULTISPECIES: queuosine precursor transporter [unclassified Phyllobacterium]MCX8281537.1 queuosine precursor transporter [Phyllobacterium sp. 0TCS1.6C]MCX8292867.1 queuosine precursor transporter [Phyllobacterium sp. 0TCS1.6A]
MPVSRAYTQSDYILPVIAMCAVVAASNFLVQFPFDHFGLGQILTYGAFTYPIAFLVNDLSNRRFGPTFARRVVYAGFTIAVILSIWLATPRIAVASGTAFLTAQLLDITVFNRLRQLSWWKAPFASAIVGSMLDTLLFFSIAFAARFAWIDAMTGQPDSSLAMPVPFLGQEIPLWASLGLGDLVVKIVMAVVMLVPYGAILAIFAPAIYSASRNSR